MENSQIEEYMLKQEAIGNEIQRAFTNFKKDPKDRKTAEYLEKKLSQLEEAWKSFDNNHLQLAPHGESLAQHTYFKSKYYESIASIYRNMKITILQMQTDGKARSTGNGKGIVQPGILSNGLQGRSIDDNSRQPTFQITVHEESDEVYKLVKSQNILMNTISHFVQTIEVDLQQPKSKAYYETKTTLLQQHAVDMRRQNQKIWELTKVDEPYGYAANTYYTMEECVQNMIIKLNDKFNELTASAGQPQIGASTTALSTLKLPEIVLSTFEGSYSKWIQFKELYIQLVHNQKIPNYQKMYYLMGHIRGEPMNLIKHLPVSSENYVSAWEILINRYDNKRLLVTALLNKFFQQPTNQFESFAAIKTLHDTTKECVLGLKNLGIHVETWDPILVHLLMKKFDRTTHTLYEQSLKSPRDLTTLNEVMEFLERRFQALEVVGGKSVRDGTINRQNKNASVLQATTNAKQQCVVCKQNHPLFSCKLFIKKSVNDRVKIVKDNQLCLNCLRGGHMATTCTLRSCTKCAKKHNTLLHVDNQKQHSKNSQKNQTTHETKGCDVQERALLAHSQPESNTDSQSEEKVPVSLATQSTKSRNSYVILGTVKLKVVTSDKKEIECRALLDSGSQLNFITKQLARKLKIEGVSDPMSVSGIGERKIHTFERVNIQLKSSVVEFSAQIDAYVLPQISKNQPALWIDAYEWGIPKDVKLADPEFNRPQKVDMLIGAELYYKILRREQMSLGADIPVLQNTVFGWVVAGKIENVTSNSEAVCGMCIHDEEKQESTVIEALEKFWKLEEAEAASTTMTIAEKRCETFFDQTTTRNESGRFVVRMPFLTEPTGLGESKDLAIARLRSIEKKLSKDTELKQQYIGFMQEYSQLGHMEEVDIKKITKPYYFLPHHCVLKPESTTTKLRVVFDASAGTTTNKSLNDVLHTGPKIQEELLSVLLRFRLPTYVFTADIEKMYRQIEIHPDDKKYQLIVWRESETKPLKYYQLTQLHME